MELARTFAELAEGLAGGGSLLLLTDYDGSLTPIVPEPTQARLSPEGRRDLRTLVRSPRVRVGVISGRALADVRARVGVAGIIYAGCHGLEVSGRGLRFRHPEAEAQRGKLEAAARTLGQWAASVPGVVVESKGLALAIHYRLVAPQQVPLVEIKVERAVSQPASRLKMLRGNQVFEILPQVDWNKGECALWILNRLAATLPRPVMLLYMGDDWTDEIAFRVLAGKAITVRVGPRTEPTAAAYRLHDVSHVLRLLSALAEQLENRSGS